MQIQTVPLSLIVPNPLQPRQVFDEEELRDLADSIAEHGVLQPIVLRPGPLMNTGERGFYLIAGERRWRASRIAGCYDVPAVVREVSALEGGVLAAVENLQRRDMTPLEEADMILTLLAAAEENGAPMTVADLGKVLGKGRGKGWIYKRLELLEFGPEVQEMVSARSETLSHAREIQAVSNPAMRARLIRFTLDGGAFLPLKSLSRFVQGAGAFAGEEALEHLIDVFERSHSSLPVLDQKIAERLREAETLRQSQHAPDAETQSRGQENARTGGGSMSRGRQIKGVSKAQALKEIKVSTDEVRRHLMNVAAWRAAAGGISPSQRRALGEAKHIIEGLLTEAQL